jgi:hypothetical protein
MQSMAITMSLFTFLEIDSVSLKKPEQVHKQNRIEVRTYNKS